MKGGVGWLCCEIAKELGIKTNVKGTKELKVVGSNLAFCSSKQEFQDSAAPVSSRLVPRKRSVIVAPLARTRCHRRRLSIPC